MLHFAARRFSNTGLPPRAAASRPDTAVLVGAILALALGLRLWGLSWGLPWAFHFDEAVNYVQRAERMVRSGDLDPRYFQNPSLFTYLIAGELALSRRIGPLSGPFSAREVGSANLWARLDSALMGTASVAVLFALGGELYGRGVGLFGALLLAASFLHVRDSHYGTNDVPSIALLLLSLYFQARLIRRPGRSWYVLAGLAGGLATSTKYSMGFFFVSLLVAHWLRKRPSGCRAWDDAGLVALAGLSGLAGYLIGTPYTVLDFARFWPGFLNQYHLGDQAWYGQSPEPIALLYLTTLLHGLGALPLALGLVGLGLAWRARPAQTVFLLAFPVVYLSFLMPKPLFFARFTLPLVPVLCLLAALTAVKIAGKVRAAWRPGIVAALAAALVAQSIANDLAHSRLLLQTDTRVLASQWVQNNLPRGSRVWVEDWAVYDVSGRSYTPRAAELRLQRFEDAVGIEDARYFTARDAQYVVTSSFPEESLPQEWGLQRAHHVLAEQAKLAARFGPGLGGRDVPFSVENMNTPFWSLQQYERPGPTVEVYWLPNNP